MFKNVNCIFFVLGLILCLHNQASSQDTNEGAAMLGRFGYTNTCYYSGCVLLSNKNTRVVLDPRHGGQVIEYSLNGENVLFINSEYTSVFDIGPEMFAPRRRDLFSGRWRAKITGDRSAHLTSVKDKSSGIQLIRDFSLDKDSSRLNCKQTMINISGETKRYCHWGRTLAVGNGICIVPLSQESRFPKGYITYGPGPVLNYRHEEHSNEKVRDGFLVISGTPPRPKFGIDSYDGWFGYITRSNILFIKQFPVFPERVYGEIAPYTVSIYYWEKAFCELEPIGPMETMKPSESASFTETWRLFPYDFPPECKDVDLKTFNAFVQENIN